MKAGWAVVGAFVLAALVLAGAAAPRAPSAYVAPVPAQERAQNAAILAALAAAGIERAWVDAQGERVLVVYELPEGMALDAAQAYALGAAAVAAPQAERLLARTTAGAEWSVPAEAVRAYQAGATTRAELEAQVVRA
ncbi:MAG TPA: hypothetical protein VM370_03275 [Candidatus Thermoplasmatota archaeon]|nr:hypothetical protein [Candidatus Thermoplasmatota archaeon]